MQSPKQQSDTNGSRLPRKEELLRVLEELYGGFAEAEETLSAIRRGEVDAFLVSTDEGEKVYTLRTAEHPYRVLIEQMREGAAILSADGTILYSNASFARLLRVPLEKVMGESIHGFIAPAGAAAFLRMMAAGNSAGSTGENMLQAHGGRRIPVYLSVQPMPMDGIQAYSLVVLDLTERKVAEETLQRAYAELEDRVKERTAELATSNARLRVEIEERKQVEERLRESEERFRLLTENASDVVVVLDAEGRISYASPSVKQVSGYAPEDLVGRNVVELAHPADLPLVTGALSAALVRPSERVGLEVRIRHSSGDWLYFDVIGINLLEEAAIRGFVVNARDITGRKRAEAALRASEERERRRAAELQALMEAVPAAIFIALDPECRSIFGSSYTYDLFRMPQGSNLSKSAPEGERPTHFRVLKDGTEVPPEELPVQKAAATGRPVERFELDLAFRDGTGLRMFGNAVPLLDENGKPHGAVGAFVDITERKQAEEALIRRTDDLVRKSEELEAARDEANMYLDIMTHDVRNANNVSSMYADLLVDLAAGDLKTYGEKLQDSIGRSSEILMNVATIRRTQAEAGRLVAVNLDALIRDEIKNFPGAAIRYDDLQVEVLADSLLPTIFTNLIGNAVKFGGPGVEITIRIEEQDAGVLVTVEDTGPGIPDEVKEKLFTRFERGRASGRGQGLGLFIVRTLVERYGGEVWIEDRVAGRPGEGAAFRFTLRKTDRPRQA